MYVPNTIRFYTHSVWSTYTNSDINLLKVFTQCRHMLTRILCRLRLLGLRTAKNITELFTESVLGAVFTISSRFGFFVTILYRINHIVSTGRFEYIIIFIRRSWNTLYLQLLILSFPAAASNHINKPFFVSSAYYFSLGLSY